jgi:hypothetical protein
MEANLDVEGVIFDILVDKYGQYAISECGYSFDELLMSNGFVSAINQGLTPMMPNMISKSMEFHHAIINNECIKMYFE